MNAPRFVRGTKSRLFLYLGAISFVGLVVYMYHGAQLQLDEVRTVSEKCQQQQESLSAQLQVIFEYKLRLEKSLQQEKNEHRQTKEELLNRAKEEKTFHDKEKLESTNKYTSLQQQYKLLQSQHDDLDEECNKVRISQLQGLEEKSKLEIQIQAVQQELEQVQAAKDKDLEGLKSSYMQLEIENEHVSKQYKAMLSQTQQSTDRINHLEKQNKQLEREVSDTKRELSSCRRKMGLPEVVERSDNEKPPQDGKSTKSTVSADQPQANPAVLPEPAVDVGSKDKVGTNSTTPQINPDAIISQDKQQHAAINNVAPMPPPRRYPGQESAGRDPRANVIPAPRIGGDRLPAGVVPAPRGYAFNHLKNSQEAGEREMGNELGNNIINPWDGWGVKRPQDPVHVGDHPPENILRFQYLNNNAENLVRDLRQRDKFLADLERNKPPPNNNNNNNNNYPYNGDYEKDGQRNDLQLEEGEEEGDDDVDQIDYANDGSKQKAVQHRKLPARVEHHDSVMAIPK